MSRKTIICDAEPEDGGDKRRLVSFVGGLDLTNGRFDTPTHSLFRTLATTHRPPDFHQACVTVGPTKGPREPWHDQAGHVSAGAASWDVLQNFTERWRRQAGDEEHALVDISGRRYVSAEEEQEAGRHRQDGWNVQILRSINEASAVFEDNNSPGLFTRRRALIDQSIHHAYIHHVRRSKKFLFFENQYCTLLGSFVFGGVCIAAFGASGVCVCLFACDCSLCFGLAPDCRGVFVPFPLAICSPVWFSTCTQSFLQGWARAPTGWRTRTSRRTTCCRLKSQCASPARSLRTSRITRTS